MAKRNELEIYKKALEIAGIEFWKDYVIPFGGKSETMTTIQELATCKANEWLKRAEEELKDESDR